MVRYVNTLLSIANGALQYYRMKQAGLAGLLGIVVATLVAWQWEHVLPALEAVGIVGFFDRIGLIHEGEAGITGLNILMFFLKLYFLTVIGGIILLGLIWIIGGFFSTSIGEKVALGIVFLIGYPILIIWGLCMAIKGNKDSDVSKEKEATPMERLLDEYSEKISKEQALIRLNRLPTVGDNLFLLGVTANNELYMFLPRPINLETAEYNAGDLVGVQYTVEKYNEVKHKPKSMFEYIPKQFFIKAVKKESKTPLEIVPNEKIEAFYLTNSEDMLSKFRAFSNHPVYENFVNEIQSSYFTIKNAILNRISNATDKEEFDKLVERATLLNATNEDIVRMMRESEKQIEA